MLKNYLKIAWRNITRHRFYTALNILGLSLGITGFSLIGLLLYYHLSFDNFHSDTDRIFRVVSMTNFDMEDFDEGVPQPVGNALKKDYDFATLLSMQINNYASLITIEKDGEEKRFGGESSAFVEPDYFKIFNYPLQYGNQKDLLSQPHTALITERLAQKFFGKSNAVGQQIKLNNNLTYTITGILQNIPERTDNRQEIYLSYQDYKEQNPWMASDSGWSAIVSAVHCFVKLKPNIKPKQVESLFPKMLQKYLSKEADKYHLYLQPLRDIHFNLAYDGKIDRKQLFALAVVGLFLLAMACMNFINLATAQAFSRAKEIGIRMTLGSHPKAILFQFLLETALLVAACLVCSFLLVHLSLPYFNRLFDSNIQLGTLPFFLSFAIVLCLWAVITLSAGYYPGIKLAQFKTTDIFKGITTTKETSSFSLRRILVFIQFSIVQLLILCTLIIAKQLSFAMKTNALFNKDGLVMLGIPNRNPLSIQTLRNTLQAITDINDFSFSFAPPITDDINNYNTFHFDHRAEQTSFQTNIKEADDHYLATFGMPLIAGQNLPAADSATAVLVNETFVKNLHFAKPEDILGKTISYGNRHLPIVGVVKDFHNVNLHATIDPIAIVNDPNDYNFVNLSITPNNLTKTLPKLEQLWKNTFPEYLFDYHFYDEDLQQMYDHENNLLKLVNLFSVAAIVIGCLGLFGLVSFLVQQKTKEIGVRKVLGASITQIVWLFGKQFAQLLLLAAIIALPIGIWIMTNWLSDFAYRISIGPDLVILGVLITIILAGLTIGYKSIKAALANPVDCLRNE